ncbi:MAG: hypothetical protein IKR48_03515 [Kiritimatiellae bacterium]|nr:hypothetical protein [Kiritimatiellia bacterium]
MANDRKRNGRMEVRLFRVTRTLSVAGKCDGVGAVGAQVYCEVFHIDHEIEVWYDVLQL